MRLHSFLSRCRCCLRPLDTRAEAGICSRCWGLLLPLPEERCPLCALTHGWGEPCSDPVAWSWGDALWNYHGGLGAILVPGIKQGELGWKAALLARVGRVTLPSWAGEFGLVCNAPTARLRRWSRGFDLAEEAAALVAARMGTRFRPVLRKPMFARAQASLSQGRRRRMGPLVSLAPGATPRRQLGMCVSDN